MSDLFDTAKKFDIRPHTFETDDFYVWRLNYFNPKAGTNADRCIAGPYRSRALAQAAIDEGRISCK